MVAIKKEITDVLKKEGLTIAEETAVTAVKGAIGVLRVMLPKVSTGFGLAFNMFMDVYEKKIYELIDKIDGVDSPEY
jgi:hypothetical protein